MKWKTEEETEFEGLGAMARGRHSLWEHEVATCPGEAARKKLGVNPFSGDLPSTVQNVTCAKVLGRQLFCAELEDKQNILLNSLNPFSHRNRLGSYKI